MATKPIVNKLQQLRAKGNTPGAPADAGLIGQIAFNKNGNYEDDPREAMYVFDEDPYDGIEKWRTVFEGKDSLQQHTVLSVQEIRMDASPYTQYDTIEEASDRWMLENGGVAAIFGNIIIGYFGNNTYIIAAQESSLKTKKPKSKVSFLGAIDTVPKDKTNPSSRVITDSTTEFRWLKLSNKALVIQDDAPEKPTQGQQWLSMVTGKTSIWTGQDWVCFPGPISDAQKETIAGLEARIVLLEQALNIKSVVGGKTA